MSNESGPRTAKTRDEEIEELASYIGDIVDRWSRLYHKPRSSWQDDLELIFEELIASGYTMRDCVQSGFKERMRRHRWELNIGLFYPDDKLITSEITSALMRAYQRGYKAGRQATVQSSAHVPITKEQMQEIKTMYELQSLCNRLQDENAQLKTQLHQTNHETENTQTRA